MTHNPDSPIDITETHVADALDRLANGRALGDSPLAHAHCISLRIRDTGVMPSLSARGWALSALLAEIVRDRLSALREARSRASAVDRAASPHRPTSRPTARPAARIAPAHDLLGAEREPLERDFLTENQQHEAWSCLYYRFIHVPPLQVQDIAKAVRPGSLVSGRKLVFRRTQLGIRLLTASLLDHERVAVRRMPPAGPGTTAAPATRPATAAPVPLPAPASNVAPDTTPPPAPHPPTRWRDAQTALDRLRADAVAGTLPLDLPRDQALLLAGHAPADLAEYRLTRIAAWCRPRHALDKRFVALSMLIDRGDDAPGGRWSLQPRRYDDLAAVLGDVPDPALVVLGAPGSGKSTLLRRLELDLAIGVIRAGGDDREHRGEPAGVEAIDRIGADPAIDSAAAPPITFFVDLGRYAGDPAGELEPPEPLAWLGDVWRTRYPGLPALEALLAAGGVILLLDALNEMPHADGADYRRRIQAWRAAVDRLARTCPGNRVIFSCRSLDYSAPLSSPELPVPQVQVEPLDDARIRAFLDTYRPDHAERLWESLAGTAQVDLFRAPYFLKLLVEDAGAAGTVPEGRGALFTRMVRGALKREVERVNPLFDPGPLVAERDYWRVVQARKWTSPYELPERGSLFAALADLAFDMQRVGVRGEGAQVRLPYDDACARLGQPHAADVLHAGEALGVLDDDAGADEVRFVHQLAQEYFAARRLAAAPDAALLRAPWRAIEIEPGVRELVDTLPVGETLPPLPQTGWEETALLAAAMTADVASFIRALAAENVVVAGRCANLPELRPRLPEALLGELRWSLVARSRDPEADLRARIAAGLALGLLGDPRFERRAGPDGEYLLPPLVALPGGVYPIGEDEPIYDTNTGEDDRSHMPRHDVAIAGFQLGQFPVTRAEYACFMAAGGYDDERWWDTEAGRAWRRGDGTAEGLKQTNRQALQTMRMKPHLVEEMHDSGQIDDTIYERWKRRLAMSPDEFEAHLAELYPGGRETEPLRWQAEPYNNPAQPVVAICWYEARAYCNWLSAQTGVPFRLPTEVELEAATGGSTGRLYAYGEGFDAAKGNTLETRLRRPTPAGVFVESDTPEGASDMAGNVGMWTSSLWGTSTDVPDYTYPYLATDGREATEAPPGTFRVVRGGSWFYDRSFARAARRGGLEPGDRSFDLGFRVVRDPRVS